MCIRIEIELLLLSWGGALFLLFSYITVWYVANYDSIPYGSKLLGFVSVPYCIMLLTIVIKLVNKNVLHEQKWLDRFCLYSFGIYVFHEPISWNCYHNEYFLELFRSQPFIYSVIFTVVVFVICYIATHFCLKTKIGKYILS